MLLLGPGRDGRRVRVYAPNGQGSFVRAESNSKRHHNVSPGSVQSETFVEES